MDQTNSGLIDQSKDFMESKLYLPNLSRSFLFIVTLMFVYTISLAEQCMLFQFPFVKCYIKLVLFCRDHYYDNICTSLKKPQVHTVCAQWHQRYYNCLSKKKKTCNTRQWCPFLCLYLYQKSNILLSFQSVSSCYCPLTIMHMAEEYYTSIHGLHNNFSMLVNFSQKNIFSFFFFFFFVQKLLCPCVMSICSLFLPLLRENL